MTRGTRHKVVPKFLGTITHTTSLRWVYKSYNGIMNSYVRLVKSTLKALTDHDLTMSHTMT